MLVHNDMYSILSNITRDPIHGMREQTDAFAAKVALISGIQNDRAVARNNAPGVIPQAADIGKIGRPTSSPTG